MSFLSAPLRFLISLTRLRIDQENASHDEENFDPSCVHQDYKEVAKKLPVFCVSSKAYQKMSGRLEHDEQVPGFTCLEETEIPALQRHALGIVHETRAVTCRFLSELDRFLTSLHLQIVQSGQPLKIADDLRENELQAVAQAVEKLKKVMTLEFRMHTALAGEEQRANSTLTLG